ncbi:MAG: hypothetical protein LBN11_06280 [Tannerella sp.]|nr:hypothetical protein [Tannerella sp.]
MVHTVYLDDTTINGRKLLKELRRYKQGIQFENPAVNGVIPEGYMTLEEFRTEAKASLTKILNKHGIIMKKMLVY